VVEPAPEPEPEPVVEPEPKRNQHRFGIGLRVGGASFMQKLSKDLSIVNGKNHIGLMTAVDLEYAWLRTLKSNPKVALGIRTGVSVNFANSSISAAEVTDSYIVTDNEYPCNNILYTVDAQQVKEKQSQFMVEVPVLFALRHQSGFVFATGPKVNIPVLGRYTTTYSNPNIKAHYIERGVDMLNKVVTGRLDGVALQSDRQLKTNKMNLLWDLELGYEWALNNGDGISLTAFGDAPLGYIGYEPGNFNTHMIEVGVPKAGGPEIKTNSLMNSYGEEMGYWDFGVKVTYYLCFDGKK